VRSVVRFLIWLAVVVSGLAPTATTTAAAATPTYDAPATAPLGAHPFAVADPGLSLPSGAPEGSASPSAELRGASTTPSLSCGATKPISTPYGAADQGLDAASVAARSQIENGATVYRIGTTGRSAGPEGQFWSLEHPSTPGYASRYGLPAENVANADFIESAVLTPGSPFITRAAPGIGDNVGGGIEVVVNPGGVTMCGFSYLGPKGC
jgi:filamentous hemagglutinin